uniref:Uncharacterized protein n=1 Tax=Anopheles christyi TaxID=43041 RepID=A0A182KI03_9DIPT
MPRGSPRIPSEAAPREAPILKPLAVCPFTFTPPDDGKAPEAPAADRPSPQPTCAVMPVPPGGTPIEAEPTAPTGPTFPPPTHSFRSFFTPIAPICGLLIDPVVGAVVMAGVLLPVGHIPPATVATAGGAVTTLPLLRALHDGAGPTPDPPAGPSGTVIPNASGRIRNARRATCCIIIFHPGSTQIVCWNPRCSLSLCQMLLSLLLLLLLKMRYSSTVA